MLCEKTWSFGRKIATTLLVIIAWVHSLPHASADDSSIVFSVQGSVDLQRTGTNMWQGIHKGTAISMGDTVRTGENSRAGIALTDGALVRLGALSAFTVTAATPAGSQTVSLDAGKAFFFSRNEDHNAVVRSPTVSAAIRGTELVVEVQGDTTSIAVLDGKVDCSNSYGTVSATNGEQVITRKGQAPTKSTLVNSKQFAQWTMYVPDLLSDLGTQSNSPVDATRIAESLRSGEVEKAAVLLRSAEEKFPSNPILGALRTLLLIVQDKHDDAIENAAGLLHTTPADTLVQISMSYALQAEGRLVEAIENLDCESDHASALMLARCAELSLALDRVRKARDYSERSVTLAHRSQGAYVYAATTLGYVDLISGDVTESLAHFEQALASDDSYPQAHLGHGLAIAQLGDSAQAIRDFSRAVALAPTHAVFRSYLGKMLFEEERYGLADEEYNRAIALDPNDPTPFLYRAFKRLAENDPIAALNDVRESQERNQRRAVYRSSLLLDQDLATRKASLAEIFGNLGFNEVARVQALQSLNSDYTNYSAHRYLSGIYSRLLKAESGRTARELGNILAPLGFNSLQPLSRNTFGEYTTLLEQNESRTAVLTDVDSQTQRLSANVIQSGRSEHTGYYLSADGAYQDFGPHSKQDKLGSLELGLQYQPVYGVRGFTSLEASTRDQQDPSFATILDGVPSESTEVDEFRATLGTTVRLAPSTTLMSVAGFQHFNTTIRTPSTTSATILPEDLVPDLGADNLAIRDRSRERPSQVQITNQILYSERPFTVVSGHESFFTSIDRTSRSKVLADDLSILSPSNTELTSANSNHADNHSFFSYGTWHALPTLDVSLGGAFTMIESENRDIPPFSPDTTSEDRFNPKVGLTWNVFDGVVVRTAYFESLERTIIEGLPSLEPAIVGAVDQRFSDLPHTISQNVVVGLDVNPRRESYLGFEGTYRKATRLEVSPADYEAHFDFDNLTESINPRFDDRFDVHEDVYFVSSYWYELLTPSLVSTLEYRYSLDDVNDPLLLSRIETQKAIAGLRAFGPGNFFLFGLGTYLDQRNNTVDVINSSSQAFLADVGVGYRLPNRYGIVEFQVKNVFDEDVEIDPLTELDEIYFSGVGVRLAASVNF